MAVAKRSLTTSTLLNKYCNSQLAQLEDSLILVDTDDKVIGSVSKLAGHLKSDKPL